VSLDSFEGRLTANLKAEFAQQYREQVRKHTRAALRRKVEQGYVAGGKVFGYDNRRIGVGQVKREICDSEAAIVREIYQRFAAGEGLRTIAGALNRAGVAAPRAQRGGPPDGRCRPCAPCSRAPFTAARSSTGAAQRPTAASC
jgi:site-specific DNA recombinase